MGLISQEFAEKMYEDIISSDAEELTSTDLELLQKLLCSQVGVNMLKRIYFYSLLAREQIMNLDMALENGPAIFAKLQGKSQGATEIISGLLGLITLSPEKDDDDE
jgi:hypothetical protein